MIAEYIASHHAEFWLIAGLGLLAIEVLTGFSTAVFLFAGLGALTTGLLMTLGVLPETWIAGIASSGISSGIITWLLWNPLKKLQGNAKAKKDNSSDLVGYEFILEHELTRNSPITKHYSGIAWKVNLEPSSGQEIISIGQKVIVTSVEVGKFNVKLAE